MTPEAWFILMYAVFMLIAYILWARVSVLIVHKNDIQARVLMTVPSVYIAAYIMIFLLGMPVYTPTYMWKMYMLPFLMAIKQVPRYWDWLCWKICAPFYSILLNTI